MSALDYGGKSLDQLVPMVNLPLGEARDSASFAESLGQVMASQIPGFIVRDAVANRLEYEHELSVPYLALAVMGGELGYDFIERDDVQQPTGETGELYEDAPGEERGFHIDKPGGREYFDGLVHALNVHHTVQGTGSVALIEAAGGERQPLNPYKSILRTDKEYRQLKKFLTLGAVDPAIFIPVVHTAGIGAGDFVVFAVNNSNGLMWHTFTWNGPRETDIKVFSPKTDSRNLFSRVLHGILPFGK
jgi:hypothetical protein